MLARLTDADVPSAVQTAPALTTHKSDLQPDFVTAVDDWLGTGDRGSAFMDTSFLTSGASYRSPR
ncbi:type I-E CRISPR-associated protein Cas7/Cse4/CasC [Streptomyces chartreusis]